MSIDEPLGAGQRFVMDNAFFTDLLAEMGDQYEIRFGLKGSNWTNLASSLDPDYITMNRFDNDVFKGNIQMKIYKSSSNNILFQLYNPNGSYGSMLVNTVALHNTMCAFIEISTDGDNIRMGLGRNGQFGIAQGDESTVIYSDWGGYKDETGDQGFGISSLDVMFLVTDIFNQDNSDFDGANVDWTELSEIAIPVP